MSKTWIFGDLWIVMRGFKNPHENREFVTDITKRIIHVISFWTRQLSNFVFFHVNIKGDNYVVALISYVNTIR